MHGNIPTTLPIKKIKIGKRHRFHPLADVLPLLEGVEFEQLVSDVAEHGLLNPIALYQGKRQEEEQQKAKAALATRDAKAAQEAKDRADALRRAGESCASL